MASVPPPPRARTAPPPHAGGSGSRGALPPPVGAAGSGGGNGIRQGQRDPAAAVMVSGGGEIQQRQPLRVYYSGIACRPQMADKGEEHKRPLMASGEGSVSKKAKAVSASPSCLVSSSSVILKQESEGEVAQGGRTSLHTTGVVAVAEQANPPMELPRINVSLQPQLLHCAVTDCGRPLKPPVFKCAAGHRLCTNCRGDARAGHCRNCGRDTTFVYCGPDLDVYIGGFMVSCPFKDYGCNDSVVYHESGAHRDACAYAPCHCALCPFKASPPVLRHHLATNHCWRVHAVPAYGKFLYLRAAVSEPPHRLLVVEGDERRLFVLSIVRASGADIWAVSLGCVRASAKAGPRYSYTLWAVAAAAPDMPADKERWLGMETDVPSCTVPGAGERAFVNEGMALCVVPAMVVGLGPAKEIHLRVRIDVVEPQIQQSSCLAALC